MGRDSRIVINDTVVVVVAHLDSAILERIVIKVKSHRVCEGKNAKKTRHYTIFKKSND